MNSKFQFAHDKLSQLPGAAQKVLFRMLEEMANTVYKSNTNEHVFRKLMDELQTTMTIYRSEVSFANMNVDSVLKFLDDVKNGVIKPFLQN